jgi:hypothetical protein
MALDPERIRFKGKAIAAAIKCGGSIEHEEAASFFEGLYHEWKSSGLGLSASEGWLIDKLKEVFRSLHEAPTWIEDEPKWPFLDGKPMIFLCQCSMPDHGVSEAELSPGETVYLFGGRKTENGKTKMVYRTVSQYAVGY